MKTAARATGLDLVRVAAAGAVFLFHGRLLAGISLGGPLADYGNLGVPVFFALSGYLVYRPFTRGPVPTVAYLARRGVRIVPAIALAMIGIGMLLPAQLPWLFVVLWSLCVEAMFYLCLPLFARLAGRHELAALALLTGPSILYALFMGNLDLPRMLLATPVYAPGWWWAFAPGMALALLERDHPGLLRPAPLLAAALALLCAEVVVLYQLPASEAEFWRSGLLVLGAVAFMAGALHWHPARGGALAALAADISYPCYLWHAPILAALAGAGGGLLVLGFAAILTIVASSVSVLLVERPFRAFWAHSGTELRAQARRAVPVPGRRALEVSA